MATRPATAPDAAPTAVGLASTEPLHGQPPQDGCSRSRIGDDEGVDSRCAGRESASGVEPKPTEPQERRTQNDEGYVVGQHRLGPVAFASSEDDPRRGQGGKPCIHVDHRAAGKVQRAKLEQPAIAVPDPVGHRCVDDGYPKYDEDDERAELDTLSKGAGNQRRGDDGEHRLEDHEGLVGDILTRPGRRRYPAQPQVFQATHQPSPYIGTKSQAVSP